LKNTSDLPSDTFCILPWIHLSTRPNGILRPCCTANASSAKSKNSTLNDGLLLDDEGREVNLGDTDLLSAWNGSYMRNIRRQMFAGEKPKSCLKCYKEEESGFRSKRQWETDYWRSRVDYDMLIENTNYRTGEVKPHITYIDLRFGSKCQLACVMCSPHDSTGWIKEWKEIHPQITDKNLKENYNWNDKGRINGSSFNWHKNNPKFWEQFWEQLPNMQQLYFAGGESLIIEEHYMILRECVKRGYAKNIELRYNSNGVEWEDDLFDLWAQFKHVRFFFSIDDIMQRNEYIRYPSKWKRTEEVLRILDEQTTDNVQVRIACAVQLLNVYYLPDFIKWKHAQKYKKINMWPVAGGGVDMHLVYLPPHHNIKVLSSSLKKKVTQKFEEFYPWWEENWQEGIKDPTVTFSKWHNGVEGINVLKGIVNFMNSEDWSERLPQTNQFLDLLDKTRNLNRSEIFSEISEIFNRS
jgi:hypothetical protein